MMKFSHSPFRVYPSETKTVKRVKTIQPSLLLTLTNTGRNLLAYIIEHKLEEGDVIYLDRLHITQYYAEKINVDYANSYNISRGIKDLIKNQVLAESTNKNQYFLNLQLLQN